MKNQIKIMLELQEQMNSKVDPNWRDTNNEWYRAIWVECAEMMEYTQWKWWKHQEDNKSQIRLEIVDVMHFMLAISLLTKDTPEHIAIQFKHALICNTTQDAIDTLANNQLSQQNFRACYFNLASIMLCVNMSFDELFKQYCAKNVLNIFRQDKGYKTGGYDKMWNGKEDNEVLFELLYAYDGTEINFMGKIREDLEIAYKEILSL